jgi:hypothetical protein
MITMYTTYTRHDIKLQACPLLIHCDLYHSINSIVGVN